MSTLTKFFGVSNPSVLYPLPATECRYVDRTLYMPKWNDSDAIRDMKKEIHKLLHRIETGSIPYESFDTEATL